MAAQVTLQLTFAALCWESLS